MRRLDWEGCASLFVILVITVFVVAILAIALYSMTPWACEARWPDHEARWTITAGCQISIDGQWVPEENVREI